MNNSLFNITASYRQLAEQLTEQEGDFTEEQENRLMIAETDLQHKSEAYIHVIKNFDMEVAAIDLEIKRLQGLKKTRQNAIKRLKNALSQAMQAFGLEKLKTGLFTLSFRKSETVSITVEADQLPPDCQVLKVEPIAKTELKKRIKSGEQIPGVTIVENRNIQIK